MLSNDELSVSVNISNDENVVVQIILNSSVKAISGPRKPKEYNVSVNLINVDSLTSMNISDCPSIINHSNEAASVALTLMCGIQPNELCMFNITAANRAGRSLIFENGDLSKLIHYKYVRQVSWNLHTQPCKTYYYYRALPKVTGESSIEIFATKNEVVYISPGVHVSNKLTRAKYSY